MSVFDRQITLNQRISVVDSEIMISVALCERFKEQRTQHHYDEAREMLSFWMSRRRWLLSRLLKIQLKQFKRS